MCAGQKDADPQPWVLHHIVGEWFHVQVEGHTSEPKFRVSIRPVGGDRRRQLELFESRSCTAQAALELSQ